MFRGLIAYAIYQVLMIIQGYLAYQQGYFWGPTSMVTVHGKVMTYWAKRHAVWSDIILLSPLAAYLIAVHGHEWNLVVLVPLMKVVGLVCLAFNLMWALYAYDRVNGFGEKKKMFAWGCCHLVYMVSILSVVVFYYLATPRSSISQLEANIATTILCGHLLVGVLYQSHYHGVLRSSIWIVTFTSCAVTLWGHYVLVYK